MDFSQAMRVLQALNPLRVDYVLVGSVAMAAQGLIRATRDMDLFVEPTEAGHLDAEMLKKRFGLEDE